MAYPPSPLTSTCSASTGSTPAIFANTPPPRLPIFSANPYPADPEMPAYRLPEVLRLQDGTPVTTAEQWKDKRRAEVLELFRTHVYGRVPKTVPKVTWEEDKDGKSGTGFGPKPPAGAVTKRFVGRVDNSACPEITVNIRLTLILPPNATGPVPVISSV